MFQGIKQKFKGKPFLYYSLSIAATWAGVGSLMMGIELLRKNGIVPFLLWALGNTLACGVFGVFAPMIPKLRELYRTKAMRYLVGLMCVFQVWVMMNGIQSSIAATVMGGLVGRIVAYSFAVFFLVLLIKNGVIRNVLTDSASWIAVYAVAFCLSVAAIIYSRGNMVELPVGGEYVGMGLQKCILLIPGPFLYPYFHELLDYNDKNADGTKKVNIRMTFIVGGVMFGAYLIFTFLLAWTRFTPALEIIKALLITLVGISTLSSFQYSIYLTFGRKLGLAVNIFAIVGWQWLIPLGVMGAWTLMSSVRIYIVAASIIASFAWSFIEKRKAARV